MTNPSGIPDPMAAGTAVLTLEKPVRDSVLASAVESAGYQVQRIQ